MDFKTIFSKAIDAAQGVARLIGGKANIGQIAGFVLGQVPAIAQTFAEFEGADKETRIRDAWEEFDHLTGIGQADVIRSLPEVQEEELFDGIKKVGLVLSLWAAGVYGPKPSIDEVLGVGKSIGSALSESTGGLAGASEAAETKEPPAAQPIRDLSEGDIENTGIRELHAHQRNPDSFLVKDQLNALRKALLYLAT